MKLALAIIAYLVIGLGIFAWRFRARVRERGITKRAEVTFKLRVTPGAWAIAPSAGFALASLALWPIFWFIVLFAEAAARTPDLLWFLVKKDCIVRVIANDLTAKSPAPPVATQGSVMTQAQMQQLMQQYMGQKFGSGSLGGQPMWQQATISGLGSSPPPSSVPPSSP